MISYQVASFCGRSGRQGMAGPVSGGGCPVCPEPALWGPFGYRKLLYVKVIFCTSELW